MSKYVPIGTYVAQDENQLKEASGINDNVLTRSLRGGIYGAGSQLLSTGAGIADAFSDGAGAGLHAESQSLRDMASLPGNASRVGSYEQLSNDFSLDNLGEYAGGLVGGSLPATALGIAGGLATGGAGVIPAMLGAGAATLPLNMGEVIQKQQADPQAMQQGAGWRLGDAFLGGAGASAVESLVPGLVGRQILGKGMANLGKESIKQMVGRNAADIPLEGLTEGAGTAIKQYAANQEKDLDWNEIKEGAIGGAAAGTVFSGVGTAADLVQGVGPKTGEMLSSSLSSIKDRFEGAKGAAGDALDAAAGSTAGKKVKSVSDDLMDMVTKGRNKVDDTVGKMMRGEELGVDPAEWARATTDEAKARLTAMSDSAGVKAATKMGKEMLDDIGLDAGRRQEVAEAMANVSEKAGRMAMAGLRQTWEAGKKAGALINRFADSVNAQRTKSKRADFDVDAEFVDEPTLGLGAPAGPAPAEDVSDVTPKPSMNARRKFIDEAVASGMTEDAARAAYIESLNGPRREVPEPPKYSMDDSGARELVMNALTESGLKQRSPELFDNNDSINTMAGGLLSMFDAMGRGPLSSEQISNAISVFGESTTSVMTSVRKAMSSETTPEGAETFFKNLNEISAIQKRSNGLHDTMRRAFTDEANLTEAPGRIEEDARLLIAHARGQFDAKSGAKPTAQQTYMNTLVNDFYTQNFGAKADVVRAAVEAEAAPAKADRVGAATTKEYDDQGNVIKADDTAGENSRDPLSSKFDEQGNRLESAETSTMKFGLSKPDTRGNSKSALNGAAMLETSRYAKQHMLDLKGQYPDHDVRFERLPDSEYGHVVVEARGDASAFNAQDFADMALDTKKFAKSPSRIDIGGHIIDAVKVAKIMRGKIQDKFEGDAPTNKKQRLIDGFKQGIAQLEIQFGQIDEAGNVTNVTNVSDDAIIGYVGGRALTWGEAQKLDARTDEDKYQDSGVQALAELRKAYKATKDPEARTALAKQAAGINQEQEARLDGELGKTSGNGVQNEHATMKPDKDGNIHEAAGRMKEQDLIHRSNMDGSGHYVQSRAVEGLNTLTMVINDSWSQVKTAGAKAVTRRAKTLINNANLLSAADLRKLQSLAPDPVKDVRQVPPASVADAREVINELARKYQDVIVAPTGKTEMGVGRAGEGGNKKKVLGRAPETGREARQRELDSAFQNDTFVPRPGYERTPTAGRAGAPQYVQNQRSNAGLYPEVDIAEKVAPTPVAQPVAETTKPPAPAKTVEAPKPNMMATNITKRQDYLNNPPADYSTEKTKGIIDWATTQLERVDAEVAKLDKLVDDPGYDEARHELVQDLQSDLRALAREAKAKVQNDKDMAEVDKKNGTDLFGGNPDPKPVAAKKAAFLSKVASGDTALLAELSSSTDAKGLQRALDLLNSHEFAGVAEGSQTAGNIEGAYEAINNRMAELVQDEDVAYGLQTKKYSMDSGDTLASDIASGAEKLVGYNKTARAALEHNVRVLREQAPDLAATLERVIRGEVDHNAAFHDDMGDWLTISDTLKKYQLTKAKALGNGSYSLLFRMDDETQLEFSGKLSARFLNADGSPIQADNAWGRTQNPRRVYVETTGAYDLNPGKPSTWTPKPGAQATGPAPGAQAGTQAGSAPGAQPRSTATKSNATGNATNKQLGKDIRSYIEKVLGKSVKLAWANFSHAGEFQRMKAGDIIRLSVHALNPMSTAYHESLHAFIAQLKDAGAHDIVDVLYRAAGSQQVINRLNEIYKNQPAVLQQLKDPEERAAYMYQIWAANPQALTIGPATRNVFQKMADFIRSVLGIWSNDERALHIMRYFNDGSYAQSMGAPNATRRALMDPGRNKAVEAAKTFTVPLGKLADALLSTGDARLRDTNIPALNKLADLIKRSGTDTGGDQGYIPAARVAATKQLSAMAETLSQYTPETLTAALNVVQSKGLAGTPEVTAAVRDIRAVLRGTKNYMEGAGVKLGDLGSEYFPRVWDTHYISQNEQAFRNMLEPYVRSGEFKGNPSDFIRGLTSRMGNEFGIETSTPGMQFTKKRDLDFLKAADVAPFLEKDLMGTLGSYITQATRRAEWERRLGGWDEDLEETKLMTLMREAKQQGATKDNLAVAGEYLKGVDGTLGDNINPHARRIMGNMIVYQNVRLLPMAMFSMLIDPMGVLVRGGNVGEAFSTFKRGMASIPETFGRKTTADEATRLAELVGVVDAAVLSNVMSDVYTQGMVGGTARKINNAFFKYNMVEGLNRSFRVGASEAAMSFIARHADMKGRHSRRWLAELGLQPGDIKMLSSGTGVALAGSTTKNRIALTVAEGLTPNQETRIHAAINQWVDGAMLRPDAADKPIWMNDPHYALISHLKQFVFSFQKTILGRMMHEMRHGNYTPAMALASYVPMMIAADTAKGLIQGGGDTPEWKRNWGVTEYVGYGIQRAGLLGVGQFGLDVAEDVGRGGTGFGALSGPTLEQFADAVQLMGGKKQFGPMLLDAMPANALYKESLGGGSDGGPMQDE